MVIVFRVKAGDGFRDWVAIYFVVGLAEIGDIPQALEYIPADSFAFVEAKQAGEDEGHSSQALFVGLVFPVEIFAAELGDEPTEIFSGFVVVQLCRERDDGFRFFEDGCEVVFAGVLNLLAEALGIAVEGCFFYAIFFAVQRAFALDVWLE